MRGKAAIYRTAQAIGGITPAHAGKSHDLSLALAPSEDHPRPCGEKFIYANPYTRQKGSPPPMRGKAIFPFRHNPAIGITPAHAGKSSVSSLSNARIMDHPRPCGEK